jgi:hypothetical protein
MCLHQTLHHYHHQPSPSPPVSTTTSLPSFIVKQTIDIILLSDVHEVNAISHVTSACMQYVTIFNAVQLVN